MTRIGLDEKDFELLVRGFVVKKEEEEVEILLADIGWSVMWRILGAANADPEHNWPNDPPAHLQE